MKICIIQISSGPNVDENIRSSDRVLEHAYGHEADLLVFPEYQMLVPDYSMIAVMKERFEPVSGRFVSHFMKISEEYGTAIALNIAEKAPDGFYNTALVIYGDKIIYKYRKNHLFDAYGFRESMLYARGKEIHDPVTIRGMKVSLFICYDLRFPELSLTASEHGSDVIIYQSGWYRGRYKKNQWNALLAARAIETGCYTVGAANCQSQFIGMSAIYEPNSRLAGSLNDRPGILMLDLRMNILDEYRRRVPVRDQRKTFPDSVR